MLEQMSSTSRDEAMLEELADGNNRIVSAFVRLNCGIA